MFNEAMLIFSAFYLIAFIGIFFALIVRKTVRFISPVVILLGVLSALFALNVSVLDSTAVVIMCLVQLGVAFLVTIIVAALFGKKISQTFYRSMLPVIALFPWWIDLSASIMYASVVVLGGLLSFLIRYTNSSALGRKVRARNASQRKFNPQIGASALAGLIAAWVVTFVNVSTSITLAG